MQKLKRQKIIAVILLVILSFGLYINSLYGDFLIDDYKGILDNPAIHSLKDFVRNFHPGPSVFWELAHAIIWHAAGQNPFCYHLFNVLADSLCVVLLFILLNNLFNNLRLSFLASLVFALHPVHTEAISWISGGHYVFSSIFFIAAMIFYVKSGKSLVYLVLAVLSFGLGFFAGNAVAMLPALFLVYDLFFRKDMAKQQKFLRVTVLSVMCILAFLFIGIFFVTRDSYTHAIFRYQGISYLVIISKAFVYYLKMLYLPLRRGLYHPFGYVGLDTSRIDLEFFFALILIAVLVYLFFRCRKLAPPVSFGIAWFFINYLPYSNIIPVCNIISERYMYLASAGFALILAWVFLKVWERINRQDMHKKLLRATAIAAITFFLGSYAVLTLRRNSDYNDLFTFWESNIHNFPQGYMAYNNLAGTYYTLGDRQQALAYSWVNLMINPNQAHVWCNLAKVYCEQGDLTMAEHCYREALAVDKAFTPASAGLNGVLGLKGLQNKVKHKTK